MVSAWTLLPWLSLPLAVRLVHTIYQSAEGPSLNKALAGTANLDLLFCVLFAGGIAMIRITIGPRNAAELLSPLVSRSMIRVQKSDLQLSQWVGPSLMLWLARFT